jgi:hypothetical protein
MKSIGNLTGCHKINFLNGYDCKVVEIIESFVR